MASQVPASELRGLHSPGRGLHHGQRSLGQEPEACPLLLGPLPRLCPRPHLQEVPQLHEALQRRHTGHRGEWILIT